MIVWIASYPRSGNTLVRTMLKHCFGVETYERESTPFGIVEDFITETIGHKELPEDWPEFYDIACEGPSQAFVKTHLPPEDDQPCIYVVRNGRQAILSYYHHCRKFFPGDERSVLDLVLGCDSYRDWSTHLRAWNPLSRPDTLLLRYEALVENPECEIDRIGDFIRFQGDVKPWRNPFSELRELDPEFFRQGSAGWAPDRLWTWHIESLFWACHGNMMDRLGYPALNSEGDFIPDPEADYRDLIASLRWFASRAIYEREVFEIAARDRLLALRALTAEMNMLRAERDVRLKTRESKEGEIAIRDAGAMPTAPRSLKSVTS